jgi:hypothetical protein
MLSSKAVAAAGSAPVQHEPADQHLAHEDRGDGCRPHEDEDPRRITDRRLACFCEGREREKAGNEEHHPDEEEQVCRVPA